MGKDITMRIYNSTQTSYRINAAFIRNNSRASEPRSASIHLLDSTTRAERNPSNILRKRAPPEFWNEMTELLTDIDGLPVLVRLLIKDTGRIAIRSCFQGKRYSFAGLKHPREDG
jgi:hypothetical protein